MNQTNINLTQTLVNQVIFECFYSKKTFQIKIPLQNDDKKIISNMFNDLYLLFKLPNKIIEQKFENLIVTTNLDDCEDLIFNSYYLGLGVLNTFFYEKSNLLCLDFVKVFYPNIKQRKTSHSFIIDFDKKQILHN